MGLAPIEKRLCNFGMLARALYCCLAVDGHDPVVLLKVESEMDDFLACPNAAVGEGLEPHFQSLRDELNVGIFRMPVAQLVAPGRRFAQPGFLRQLRVEPLKSRA